MTTLQNRVAARSLVAAKVRSMAAEKRVSIRALADSTGLDYSAMLRRTRGQVDFTVADLIATADALGVNVAALMPAPTNSQSVAS